MSLLLYAIYKIQKLHYIPYERCINGEIVLDSHVYMKVFNFEIQCGQILFAHKPYFLIPGHIIIVMTIGGRGQINAALCANLSLKSKAILYL